MISSSRALGGCIALAGHKELRDVSLDGVRMLLLEDGANPCEFYQSTRSECMLTLPFL